MRATKKLLGELAFVSRTFEGQFKDSPYVLDMDANLYIGPADHLARDQHAGIEVVFHFLTQTGRINLTLKKLLQNRISLLDAFAALDAVRRKSASEEFRLFVFGTYDGELLLPVTDDELPAGPCGKSINELKRCFYGLCRRIDVDFEQRQLNECYQNIEARFLSS